MQKTSTIIIFFLFLGAALAGCTQEEINPGCNDPKATNFGEPAPEGAKVGDDTCNYDPIPMPNFEENEMSETNSTDDSELIHPMILKMNLQLKSILLKRF